ncbi:MAG: hypothetical protein ACMUHM_08685 [Thermoplasmatota archaeon]
MNILAEGAYLVNSAFMHVDYVSASGGGQESEPSVIAILIGVGLGLLLLSGIAGLVLYLLTRSKKKKGPPG